jgi:hypothetical protein
MAVKEGSRTAGPSALCSSKLTLQLKPAKPDLTSTLSLGEDLIKMYGNLEGWR